MRLDMRSLAGAGAVVLLSFASVSCCSLCTPQAPVGDVVSGAPKGSALVKVLVTLTDVGGTCTARVDPPRVTVFRGSAIRWMVDNRCTKPPADFLQFTRPTPRPAEGGASHPAEGVELPLLLGPDGDPQHREGTQRALVRGARGRRPRSVQVRSRGSGEPGPGDRGAQGPLTKAGLAADRSAGSASAAACRRGSGARGVRGGSRE